MARNLRKFATMADYEGAELEYPAVSWIVSGDTLAYDKTEPQPEPQPETEKVVLVFTASEGDTGTIKLYNGEGADADQITGLTFNGEPIDPIEPELFNVQLESVNTIEYAIEGTTIGDAFTGDLTDVGASSLPSIEFLIPSFITDVHYLPNNQIDNLVFMATTPPESEVDFSSLSVGNIYVPDESLNDYDASVWASGDITVLPLSEYDGNLPITNNEN